MGETHWKKITDPNYLGSWDIPSSGIKVTINRVFQAEIFNQTKNAKEHCMLMKFSEGYKPMVVNKTNGKTMQKLTGTPYIEKWAGQRIEIKTERIKAFGEMVDALRISKTAPQAESKPQQEQQAKPTEAEPHKCEDCSAVVTEFGGYSAQQVALATKGKYGRVLCSECAKKAKEELEGAK